MCEQFSMLSRLGFTLPKRLHSTVNRPAVSGRDSTDVPRYLREQKKLSHLLGMPRSTALGRESAQRQLFRNFP